MGHKGARVLAHEVLLRVARDNAWAERALSAAFLRHPLDDRDRALATELVYGTLRNQSWLDFLLQARAHKPLKKLPMAGLLGLRLSAFQIVATRVPDYSAVNEGVALVRQRHPHLAGVANAILRRLAADQKENRLPEPEEQIADPATALATRYSLPVWLTHRVDDMRGREEMRAWAVINNEPPLLGLRHNALLTSRENLAQAMVAAGHEVKVPPEFKDGLWVRGGRVEEFPGFAAGHFAVQDLAAQLVGRLVSPLPGQIIVDACAAPGGKSTHLAELMANRGRVLAIDIHPGKTRSIAANAARLGTTCVQVKTGDATSLDFMRTALAEMLSDKRGIEGGVPKGVDGVLIDAPCSGSGTLRRNPELRWRMSRALAPLCRRQDQLLNTAAELVEPGGFIVYAVCSILPDEGEERITRFLAGHPDFAIERPADPELEPFLTDDGMLRTWPQLHLCDGFFAARLWRR